MAFLVHQFFDQKALMRLQSLKTQQARITRCSTNNRHRQYMAQQLVPSYSSLIPMHSFQILLHSSCIPLLRVSFASLPCSCAFLCIIMHSSDLPMHSSFMHICMCIKCGPASRLQLCTFTRGDCCWCCVAGAHARGHCRWGGSCSVCWGHCHWCCRIRA